jgi:hypothetical protein
MEPTRIPEPTTRVPATPSPATPRVESNTIDRPFERPMQAEPPADSFVENARVWIEENPGLAVLAAVGLGLVAGRLIGAAIPEPEPTLSEKVQRRARAIAKTSAVYATDAGDVAGRQLGHAAEALTEAAHVLAGAATQGYGKAKDVSEIVMDAVRDAIANVASSSTAKDIAKKVSKVTG